MSLPILDVGPFLRGEPGSLNALAQEMRAACEGVGFYFLVNHGVAQQAIDQTFHEAQRFHALAMDEKRRVLQGDHYVGYVAPSQIRIDVGDGFDNKTNKADVQAAYHVGRDYSPEHPLSKQGVRYYVPQPWPHGIDGFKENISSYFTQMETLGRRLLPVYAAALDAPLDTFDAAFEAPLDYLRLIHYPKVERLSEDQFGLGAHTDAGFLTFLPQTKVPGLEIMMPDGRWIAQPIVPGAYLVNAGQTLKRWSNNRFRSTPHRVISPTGAEDRYSIPFFFNPGYFARIEVISSCVDDQHPPAYPPITYGEHLVEYLANTYRPAPARAEA